MVKIRTVLFLGMVISEWGAHGARAERDMSYAMDKKRLCATLFLPCGAFLNTVQAAFKHLAHVCMCMCMCMDMDMCAFDLTRSSTLSCIIH